MKADDSRFMALMRRLSPRLEGYLALIFGLLGLMLTLLIALHWFLLLEPTLRAEAESRAAALAQSQVQEDRTADRRHSTARADATRTDRGPGFDPAVQG
ncbi:MAG: hypothetical protein MZV65_10515 [Chromatiales bacterium]|nr:hypothetical protein [Chromatiales bacterium]